MVSDFLVEDEVLDELKSDYKGAKDNRQHNQPKNNQPYKQLWHADQRRAEAVAIKRSSRSD